LQEVKRVYLLLIVLNFALLLSNHYASRKTGQLFYSLIALGRGAGRLVSDIYYSARQRMETIARADRIMEENRALERALTKERMRSLKLRQELEKLKNRPPLSYPSLFFARTVFLNPVNIYLKFAVEAGWGQGIRERMAVVDMEGNAVGKVVSPVSYSSSWVRPITYPLFSTGVKIGQYYGVARGTGQAFLEVDYIYPTSSVKEGDEVFTSGLDGVFPPGLPVGKVVFVRRTSGLFLKIKVKPRFSLRTLKWVGIIRKW